LFCDGKWQKLDVCYDVVVSVKQKKIGWFHLEKKKKKMEGWTTFVRAVFSLLGNLLLILCLSQSQ